MQQFTGTGKYVFPSFRSKDRPMRDNTLIGALRNKVKEANYKDAMRGLIEWYSDYLYKINNKVIL